MTEILGRCYGETSPTKVSFISNKIPAVNEYVYLEYNNKIIMGIIDNLFRGSFTLSNDLTNQESIGKIVKFEGDDDQYIRGEVTILGDIEKLEIPRTPAPIGTEIRKATVEQLKILFSNKNKIKIGNVLSQPDVAVELDGNKMISRHLGILAMTGAGKSNTTSVIIDELLSYGGTIVVYDMHSEYEKIEFTHGKKKLITPKINPRDLSIPEFKMLCNISDGATNQEKYLRDAYEVAEHNSKNGTETPFVSDMITFALDKAKELEAEKKNKSHIDAANQIAFKLEDMLRKYGTIFDSTDVSDIVNTIEFGKVNIIGLNDLNEKASDILVKHVLTEILRRRKNFRTKSKGLKIEVPIFNIIEEAHILASQRRNTRSKSIIGRIAREGRKFGVGLCLVSQSPKSLDSEALSQVNNLIILRLVEPSDQAHVQKSSESLSEDLLKKLPSLNIGEAIILGQMTKVPTMVKIDRFKGKNSGNDLDIIGIWQKDQKEREEEKEHSKRLIDEMGI